MLSDTITDEPHTHVKPDDRAESLSERIYLTLRQRIILGELAPESRLTEQRLADELDVSRIPLREAMSRLVNDSLVTASPRRSARVASWNASDIHDLFDARLALETRAGVRATQRSAALEPLEAALRASESEMVAGAELGFAEANVRFHVALVAAAGNPLLDGLMRAIASRMTWLFYLTASRDHITACREHDQIVEAIRDGNQWQTEALIYAHIEGGRKDSLATLASLT